MEKQKVTADRLFLESRCTLVGIAWDLCTMKFSGMAFRVLGVGATHVPRGGPLAHFGDSA